MFVQTEVRPQGEQQVSKLKLSEAIRAGLRSYPEIRGSWDGCAIGLAHRALHEGENLKGKFSRYFMSKGFLSPSFTAAWAEDHGFDQTMAEIAEQKNNEGMPAAAVADWLESRGY